MKLSNSLVALASMGAAASVANAAIIPSWRVNTITPAAIAASPALANARSISLMVELTGGSLFNVAGLDLSFLGPGVQYFNQVPFGSDTKPSAAIVAVFPDVEFDTYVGTTGAQVPAVPGRLNGTGIAQVGTDGAFNVSWGATPNTGGTGLLEIARITVLGVPPGDITVPLPISNGLVADSLSPNTNIPLPPIPLAIPEPMGLAIAGVGMLVLRRARR